jgi:hypothetical protein
MDRSGEDDKLAWMGAKKTNNLHQQTKQRQQPTHSLYLGQVYLPAIPANKATSAICTLALPKPGLLTSATSAI